MVFDHNKLKKTWNEFADLYSKIINNLYFSFMSGWLNFIYKNFLNLNIYNLVPNNFDYSNNFNF